MTSHPGETGIMQMQFHLSDEPRVWRRFTLQFCGIMVLLSGWLTWRGTIRSDHWLMSLPLYITVGLSAWLQPRWFRGFYRFGMTASAWLGDRMGRVILTLFFFLIMVPLGWGLRLTGYDPLFLKKKAGSRSYWRPAGKTGRLDQMY